MLSRFSRLDKLILLGKKVRQVIVDANLYDKKLFGGCGTASFHLMRCARKNGMHVKFVHGPCLFTSSHCFHAWVEYHGHIIDLTKSQFDDDNKHSEEVAVLAFNEADHIYDLKNPGIRTNRIGEAWKWIDSWARYPDRLKNNLITL